MKISQRLSSKAFLCRFVAVRYLAAACTLSGCVPSTAYEQANSAADVEREGHRRAAERLARIEDELEQVRAERDRLIVEKDKALDRLVTEETRLAQASLDIENGQKETEQQQQLVSQLRGELARFGEHMKTFAGEKSNLESELVQAQSALEKKNRRILALEAEVAGLKNNAKQADAARDQLSDALDELSSLQEEVGEESSDEETADDAVSDEPPDVDDDNEVLPAETPN